MEKPKNKPSLRFPEFKNEWIFQKIGSLTKRISYPVNVEQEKLYQQIGIRSHGKGIFHKEFVNGKTLGNKRVFWVKEDMLIVNIVFAWEQAVAKTSTKEIGMIASHRFPMYSPIANQSNLDYLLYFFLTKKGKTLLELASPGGAGRNKTLGQKEFENLKFLIPSNLEQEKIASFLTTIVEKVEALKKKKNLLQQYKKGVMKKIFSQEIRFKDDNEKAFPKWEKKKLGKIFYSEKGKGLSKDKIIRNGINECILYGELYTKYSELVSTVISKTNDKEGLISEKGDLLIPSSTTTTGIDLANVTALNKEGVLLGGDITVLRTKEKINNVFYAYYLSNHKKKEIANLAQGSTIVHLYYNHIKTMDIDYPSFSEQSKIADFLSAIDEKINHCNAQIVKSEQYKKGLQQQMFC